MLSEREGGFARWLCHCNNTFTNMDSLALSFCGYIVGGILSDDPGDRLCTDGIRLDPSSPCKRPRHEDLTRYNTRGIQTDALV